MKSNIKTKLKANKKVLMIILVGCLFLGAVYLNVSLNQNKKSIGNVGQLAEDTYKEANDSGKEGNGKTDGSEQNNGNNESYFEAFRNDRDDVRAREIEYLDEIIAASASDDETLSDAQEHKLTLVANMEKEFTIEQLVKAKGFSDAAVTFKSGTANIVVDKEVLSDEDVAKILEIVMNETGLAAKNIKIIPNA